MRPSSPLSALAPVIPRASLRWPVLLALLVGIAAESRPGAAATLTSVAPEAPAPSPPPGALRSAEEERAHLLSRSFPAGFHLEPIELVGTERDAPAVKSDTGFTSHAFIVQLERSRAAVRIAPNLLPGWRPISVTPPTTTPRLPDSAEGCMRRATALLAEQKRAEAIPLLLRAQSLKPRDFPLALKIGALLQTPETVDEAQSFAQKLVERFPKKADAWWLLGFSDQQAGRNEEALASLKRGRQLDPKSAAIWFAEGEACGSLQRWEEAAVKFLQAVRLEPKNERYWRGLTDCYRTSRDLLAGEMKLKQFVEEFPKSAPAWYSLGCLQVAGGLRQIGLNSWRHAVELQPNYADAWSQLGVLQLQEGDRRSARESFERALQAQPHHAEAANNRGWLLLGEGKLGPAITDFQTAIKSDPNYTRAMVNLIRAFLQNGDLVRANEVCDRLANLDAKAGATMRAEIAR